MNKKKILLGTLLLGTMMTTSFGTVLAAPGTGETPVAYDNRNDIPDPENPDTPEWAVTIPSAITFTDDNKVIDASVELVAKGSSTTLPTDDISVTVESLNNYKLKNGADEISYKLKYGGTEMSDTVTAVATLNDTAPTKSGQAILGSESASARGTYSDTLTYTITK